MKPIPLTDETRAIAARLVWFEPAEAALADPVRFMAYAFARATHADMKTLRADGSMVPNVRLGRPLPRSR